MWWDLALWLAVLLGPVILGTTVTVSQSPFPMRRTRWGDQWSQYRRWQFYWRARHHEQPGYPFKPAFTVFEYTGSGGATAGGAATIQKVFVYPGSGGGTGGGAATVKKTFAYVGTGGGTGGGAATIQKRFVYPGSGGGAAGGAAATVFIPAGGPTPPPQLAFNWIAAGGGAPVWWPNREHPLRRLIQPWEPQRGPAPPTPEPKHPKRVPVRPKVRRARAVRAAWAPAVVAKRQLPLPYEGLYLPEPPRDPLRELLEADDELLLVL